MPLILCAGTYHDDKHSGEITHFQALTAAISGTVGIGNIAGVAITISLAGPGAVLAHCGRIGRYDHQIC